MGYFKAKKLFLITTYDEIKELATQLVEAKKIHEDAKREIELRKGEWEITVDELGLEASINPSAAVESLNRSQELFEKLDRSQGLEERILGIEKEGKNFGLEVSDLATQVTPDLSGRPIEQAAAAELYARLLKAREHFATLGSLKQERESHQRDFETAMDTIGKMEDRLKGLLRQAGCLHPEEIEEVERRSTLSLSLKEELEQLGKQLLAHAAAGRAIEKFIAEAEGLNPDSLPLEIKAAHDNIKELEEELSVLDRTIGSEQTELRKMDGTSLAAEAAEKAQEALAQIVDNSE